MKSPARGEVWIVDLGLAAKVRPAVVVSVPATESDRPLVTLVPHTTSLRGSRFEVVLPVRFLRPGGFNAQSLVTISTAKLLRPVGKLTPTQLAQVEAAVCAWPGLSRPT